MIFLVFSLVFTLFTSRNVFCAEDIGFDQRIEFVTSLNHELQKINGKSIVEDFKNNLNRIRNRQKDVLENEFFSDTALTSFIEQGDKIFPEGTSEFVYSGDMVNAFAAVRSNLYKISPPLLYFFNVNSLVKPIHFFAKLL